MEYHHRADHSDADSDYPMVMKKGFFDLKKPGWRLVICDLAIGIPLSLVVSYLIKYVVRLIFTVALYIDVRGLMGGAAPVPSINSTTINGTAGPSELNVRGNKEAWKQWERLLCGLVFAITNSILVLIWAIQIEVAGIEKLEKEQRLRIMREEAREWESLVGKLENVLDAVQVEKSLTPEVQRFTPRLAQPSGIKATKCRVVDVQQSVRMMNPLYEQIMEERRRRSDGPPPETSVLGQDEGVPIHLYLS